MKIEKIEKLNSFGLTFKLKVRIDNVPEDIAKILFSDSCKIEQYNDREGYLIFVDKDTNKNIIFTKKVDCFRNQNDNAFEYIEPCEFCQDENRI